MARIGAVLLAAGGSRRFGATSKLTALFGGVPLVRRTARTLEDAGLEGIVAVTGAEHEACVEALSGLGVRVIRNADWRSGMGASVAAGIAALETGLDGAFIVPADMPFLSKPMLRDLIAAFEMRKCAAIVYAATAAGEQRNPVLWPQRYFAALARLEGERGAKGLLEGAGAEAVAVPFEDWRLADIDTPEDLAAAQARLGS